MIDFGRRSPWPILMSIILLFTALGGVMYMHSLKQELSQSYLLIFTLLVVLLIGYIVFYFKAKVDRLDLTVWLLLAIGFNSYLSLLLQDDFQKKLLNFLIAAIYVTMILISLKTSFLLNAQRLVLLIFFTGASSLYNTDVKTTVSYFAAVLLVNWIIMLVLTRVEGNEGNYEPYLTRISWVNQILIYRYYFAVRFFSLITELLSSWRGKLLYVVGWSLFYFFCTFTLESPGVALVVSQIFGNLWVGSSYSVFSLMKLPKLREHTAKNLNLQRRKLYTEGLFGKLNQRTIQTLAVTGAFVAPWATYSWIKERQERMKKFAIEHLAGMSEELRSLSPSWVKSMEFQANTGIECTNYKTSLQEYLAALRTVSQESRQKKESSFTEKLLEQLAQKDIQLAQKDIQLAQKDGQIIALLAQSQTREGAPRNVSENKLYEKALSEEVQNWIASVPVPPEIS